MNSCNHQWSPWVLQKKNFDGTEVWYRYCKICFGEETEIRYPSSPDKGE